MYLGILESEVSANTGGMTGIHVTTKFFPLAFLLLFCKTVVTIDGAASVEPWGSRFFNVPPGTHEVTVSFRYFFFGTYGGNSVTAEVEEGKTTAVRYRAPFVIYMRGRIAADPPSADPPSGIHVY